MKIISGSLTRKLVLMGIVMVIAFGIFIASTYIFTQRIEGDAARINHAGRLRYRSFKTAWLASRIIEARDIGTKAPLLAELNIEMERFDKAITELKDGSAELGIGPMEYEKTLALLAGISDEWHANLRPMLSDMAKLPKEKAGLIRKSFDARIEGYVYEKVDMLVSELEDAYNKKTRDFNVFRLYAFGFFFMATAFVVFYARKNIVIPVWRLRDAIKEVEKGNLNVQAPVNKTRESGDELIKVSFTFNDMVRALRFQIEETKMLLKNLEEKNSELLKINRELQSAKEQIEVAYEESQTQSEELESANEELRILNEDLDKKTRELLEVNKRLKTEEENTKRAKDELQLIFDGIEDEIVFFDLDYHIVKANKTSLERHGLQAADLPGKKCYSLLKRGDAVCEGCIIKETYNTKRMSFIEAKNPHDRILQKFAFPILEGNKLLGVVELIKDVTEQRLLEQSLVQAEKLTSLGEMLSGIAHELNNPLTGIIGFSELISEKETEPGIKKDVQKINQEALRCKKIVQNLLVFARRHKPEREYININDIIYYTMELREYELKVNNIQVVTDLDKNLPPTMIDAHQIQQVFLNIINNAQQAMLDYNGEGTLTIKTVREDDKIKISFKDTGPGIPPENINKIFNPFFTTKGVGKGTGLGLSVSYGIIKEHQGKIYAVSRPGEGAVFVIELPIVKPDKKDKTQ